MATKIKFSFLKMFFRLFSFLADKTGGWKIFVQPKIMLGTMILGLGVAACGSAGKDNGGYTSGDTSQVFCYEVMPDCYQIGLEPDTITLTIDENDPNKIYAIVDKKAEFPGGDRALLKFIEENLECPIQSMDASVQGRVFVKFVVEKTGEITNIEVVRVVHKSLDEEAVKLVKKMPKWQPAEISNTPVRSYFTLPVNFKC